MNFQKREHAKFRETVKTIFIQKICEISMPPNESKLLQPNKPKIQNMNSSNSPFADVFSQLPPTPEGRTLIISRHGESEYNLEDRIGGNPRLSANGEEYARKMAKYINEMTVDGLKVNIDQNGLVDQ